MKHRKTYHLHSTRGTRSRFRQASTPAYMFWTVSLFLQMHRLKSAKFLKRLHHIVHVCLYYMKKWCVGYQEHLQVSHLCSTPSSCLDKLPFVLPNLAQLLPPGVASPYFKNECRCFSSKSLQRTLHWQGSWCISWYLIHVWRKNHVLLASVSLRPTQG